MSLKEKSDEDAKKMQRKEMAWKGILYPKCTHGGV
jgi:hypothetical protein